MRVEDYSNALIVREIEALFFINLLSLSEGIS